MSKESAESLRTRTLAYLKEWKKNGYATALFHCPLCGEENETTAPSTADIWTSACTCYWCEGTLFRRVAKDSISVIKIGSQSGE